MHHLALFILSSRSCLFPKGRKQREKGEEQAGLASHPLNCGGHSETTP